MNNLILVDSSVWIALLRGMPGYSMSEAMLMGLATCGPVLQEVFQGLRPGRQSDGFQESFRALPVLSDPVPIHLYATAADLYRLGRARRVTIRSSVDCLIAAIALEHRVPVWHRDRDFSAIASFTALTSHAMR